MNNSIPFKTDRIKIPITIIVVCSLIAFSLFFIRFFVHTSSERESSTEKVTAYEQGLQSQITDISNQISGLNRVVSQLQTQIKAMSTQTGSQQDQQVLSKIDTMTLETEQLTNEINLLQSQMATMQDKLKAADTTIGITPIIMNGLSVIFITDSIELGMIGSSNPIAGQFAIKIANTTDSAFSNVDITGTITSSQHFSIALASGYPQLVDGSGTCSYVFYVTQDKIMNFEAFGNGKTSLSIPPGGSITIRPKITLLAATNGHFPAASFCIALKTITYDKAATTK
jgi:uncharacterized protein YlxW (UPF0749 family)